MKGISAVIAAILMLMITMALAGVAYFYISGIFASKTTLIEAVGDVEVIKPYTGGDLAKCRISWFFKNTGTAALSVTVKSANTDCQNTNPGDLYHDGKLEDTGAVFTMNGGNTTNVTVVKCGNTKSHVYKAQGPSNSISLIAFCP